MSTSISARQLTVEFPIFENSHRSLKKKVLHLTTGGTIGNDAGNHPVVCALDALDFEFKDGDRVGLVGHNGSGKTTLLRVLSGIYSPTRGQLKIKGKTASLLDVSTGVDPDATGFENIYLRGIMNGFKPSMIRSKIDEIADFTELGEYLNLPVRTYSSGMMLRLTFAISTSIQADILLMDEWLSVGDADFREKAAKRLKALVDNASILVIASHNPELIDNVCNKKLQLEHGKIVASEVLGQASNPAPTLA
ncbi:ABC transporter ATP-binding protein [Hydrogenophaga sp. D2P1]|uniref:ABC transporter ATP-binding protein n=1 Tax=Hydrogenophaga aromaticivorans TaxID=2610898 RepID=A0A7Y8H030_9BURK|nr:ABC transporter ATP-binding protein [Hydrogenophaga aromaticivorans]NWF48004.1 ABC transporter ATP-binding protein [Hydrogenophaga aromaticivorans]